MRNCVLSILCRSFITDWPSAAESRTLSESSSLCSSCLRSPPVYKDRVILRPASNCDRPQVGARRGEEVGVGWGWGGCSAVELCFFFFLLSSSSHVCVLREFTCGGGGATLEESVPHPRMHVGLPWVNPPTVRVCACVLAFCVTKSLVAESGLNKGSFWIGFQDDQRSCWGWEALADRRVLKVCSPGCLDPGVCQLANFGSSPKLEFAAFHMLLGELQDFLKAD